MNKLTDFELAQATIERLMEQQRLMVAISQSFSSMGHMHQMTYEALQMAGEFMGISRAFLSKYQKDEGYLECLCEWYNEEGRSIERADKWPLTPDMELYKDLTAEGYVAINDYIRQTHPCFEAIKGAFLNISIEISGEFWGVIGFIIHKEKYEWSESDVQLGKWLASMFSGAISRNIAEENLLRAKEFAEQTSRYKSEFLSRMSHEMRTPMNAIIGMTRIAQHADDLQKVEYFLGRIDNSSQHLLFLINDILDMSKIEANKMELSDAEFDFERMLMNITGLINYRIEEKSQNLIIHIDKEVPSALINDEMRLSQVIMNLLTNAIKFTPEGGTIILNVHNIEVSDEISTLHFEVTDNGIGISPKQQEQIFTPFEQADGGLTRQYSGTGLGLTICKGIVELMGGRIWVESELERGSKFSFIIKTKVGKGILRTGLAVSMDHKDFGILAVEGIPEIKNYLAQVFGELSLPCDIADSEAVALEMIRQRKGNPYNIIFIDPVMPGPDSIELVTRLKNANSGGAIILIIPEAEWSNIEKGAGMEVAHSFVFKPLFASMIINAINKAMGAIQEEAESQKEAGVYDFRDHTVMVAEDIEINREIIQAVLEDTGLSIDFAQNGAQAFSMFKNNMDRYSLILMDIQMPEIDGYEATRRIRSLDAAKAKSIPVIAMTANVFCEDVEQCLQAGMNDHFGKPIDTEKLLRMLDHYLSYSCLEEERRGEH